MAYDSNKYWANRMKFQQRKDIDFHLFEHTYGQDKVKDLRFAKSQLLAILFQYVQDKTKSYLNPGFNIEEKFAYAMKRRWYRSKAFGRMQLAGVPIALCFKALDALIADGFAQKDSEIFTKTVHFIILTHKGYDFFKSWYDKKNNKEETDKNG